jgi:hypothetical protein
MSVIALTIAPAAHAQQKEATARDERPSATAAEIATWITELNDNRYLVRERATRQLLDAGPAALDALLAAADSDRPEPSDRSIWILRRLSTSKDVSLKRQALQRMANMKKRPQAAAAARETLAEIDHTEALRVIEEQGGRYIESEFPAQVGPLLLPALILDERWRGSDSDLVHVPNLNSVRHVVVIGTNLSADGLKVLAQCKTLQQVWLYGTKLKPDDVARLRAVLPAEVLIDYRRGGLLGVGRTVGSDTVGPAVVNSVTPGSAAAGAGIQPEDVIQKFNGEAVANFKALTTKIADHQPGDEVTISVLRKGEPLEFKLKLGQWKTIE